MKKGGSHPSKPIIIYSQVVNVFIEGNINLSPSYLSYPTLASRLQVTFAGEEKRRRLSSLRAPLFVGLHKQVKERGTNLRQHPASTPSSSSACEGTQKNIRKGREVTPAGRTDGQPQASETDGRTGLLKDR